MNGRNDVEAIYAVDSPQQQKKRPMQCIFAGRSSTFHTTRMVIAIFAGYHALLMRAAWTCLNHTAAIFS